jgi:dynein heavy chain
MKSGVGVENVKLNEPLKLVGKVENYLQDLINSIVITLRGLTTRSFINHTKEKRDDWIKMDPAQITILVNNTITSNLIEECFRKISDGSNVNGLKDYYRKSVEMLTGLIKMVQGELTRE